MVRSDFRQLSRFENTKIQTLGVAYNNNYEKTILVN